jgi:hypothetical protein
MDEFKPQGNSDWVKSSGLLLEDEVGCDAVGCRNQATWHFKASCCGTVFLMCLGCTERIFQMLTAMAENSTHLYCKHCSKRVAMAGWLTPPNKL